LYLELPEAALEGVCLAWIRLIHVIGVVYSSSGSILEGRRKGRARGGLLPAFEGFRFLGSWNVVWGLGFRVLECGLGFRF
jgi:hypothetical protein